MSEERVANLVRELADGVSIAAAPVESVLQRGHQRARSRRRAITGTVSLSVVLAAVVIGVLVRNTDNPAPGPAGVVRVENPLPIPWWGDGTLHLAHLTVPVPDIEQLVPIGDAVAYTTESGDVVLVDSAGRSRTLADQRFVATLAASSDDGWLAWVDPRDRTPRDRESDRVPGPQLVVYDIDQGSEIGRLDLLYRGPRWSRLDGGSYPIAIDQSRVYYAGQDGDWSWVPGEDDPVRMTRSDVDLLDVRNGHLLSHAWTPEGWSEDLRAAALGNDDTVVYRGDHGQYSPDAAHIAVMADRTIRVFPFGSHTPVRLDVPRGWSEWGSKLTFADASTAVLIAAGDLHQEPASDEGPFGGPRYDSWDISTCNLNTGACVTIEDATKALPVLSN